MLSPRMHNVTAVLLVGVGATLSLDRVVRRRLDGPSVQSSCCEGDGLHAGVSPSVATCSESVAFLSPHGCPSVAESSWLFSRLLISSSMLCTRSRACGVSFRSAGWMPCPMGPVQRRNNVSQIYRNFLSSGSELRYFGRRHPLPDASQGTLPS
jgi:hypothetical protein